MDNNTGYFLHCPVEGDINLIPYTHLWSTSYIARKCLYCTRFFEGDCWIEVWNKKSEFVLTIKTAKGFGENALKQAFEEVRKNFSLMPDCKFFKLVIEGDGNIITLNEFNDISSYFLKRIPDEIEFSSDVYIESLITDEVMVSIVQELP
jgi:hypothetical protein